jgi:hypothetical protein
LLLEAGFLAVILCFADNAIAWRRKSNAAAAASRTAIFLVQWLLFRLMFSSGIVKLLSQGPEWWNLTAFKHHFETTCIPHIGSFLAYHMPDFVAVLSCGIMFFVEIVMPFVTFAPTSLMRRANAYLQVLLQFMIMSTGQFNFFNLLTIALALSLLDDDARASTTTALLGNNMRTLTWITNGVVLIGVAVGAVVFVSNLACKHVRGYFCASSTRIRLVDY